MMYSFENDLILKNDFFKRTALANCCLMQIHAYVFRFFIYFFYITHYNLKTILFLLCNFPIVYFGFIFKFYCSISYRILLFLNLVFDLN